MCPAPAERRFPADAGRVGESVRFVADLAAAAGLETERIGRLELAVEEAVVNVCHYAYPSGGGEVVVRVTEEPGRLTVEVEDSGAAFDPLSVPAPDVAAPVDERRIGGLGILLIQRLMDEVRYRREGGRNVLTMVVRPVAGDR
jgi:serine/threonine-protein kinase RsbW